jgi:tetratricopeptide (TPR) repeat protein/predicted Ser/Thr protein kinase
MIGKTISHYKILEKLGEGGMGVVYKAEDLMLGRTVALKFLPPDSVAREEDRARLIQEARAAAALLHPNICPIHEISEADGRTFIAMAHIEGRSLMDRIAESPLPLDEALPVARQIGDALAAAHAKGIIHRDIKPANIMLTADGRPMLMDFGLAKVSGTTKLTRTGTTMGTVAYMSPEQVQGREADQRSDIWALGAVLYEMVSGRSPFSGDYEAAMLYSILNEDPEPLAKEGGDVPAGLDGIIAKALAKDPARRYQGAAELVADLDALSRDSKALPAGKAIPARGVRRLWRRWRLWQRAAAIASIVALAAIVAVLTIHFWPSARDASRYSIAVMGFRDLATPDDPTVSAGLTELVNMGLTQADLVRVVSSDLLLDLRRRLFASPRGAIEDNQTMEIARKAEATLFLVATIGQSGTTRYVNWRLVDARSGQNVDADRAEGDTDAGLADQIIAQVMPVIAHACGVEASAVSTTIESITTENPRALRHYMAGVLAAEEGRRDEAVTEFKRATTQDTTFALAYLHLAQIYTGYQDWRNAGEYLERAWSFRSRLSTKDRMRLEAKRLALTGEPSKQRDAAELLRAMRTRWPDDYLVLIDLGDLLSNYWHTAEALEVFEEGRRLFPDDAALGGRYASVLGFMGRYREALRVARADAARNPKDPSAWDLVGSTYLGLGQPDSAETAFREATKIDPTWASENYGRCAYWRGDLKAAIRVFEQILAQQDLSANRREELITLSTQGLNMAALYIEAGQYQKARRVSREYMDSQFGRANQLLLMMGSAQEVVERIERARAEIERKHRYSWLRHRGMALAMLGDAEGARRAASEDCESLWDWICRTYAPLIHAEAALVDGNPQMAFDSLNVMKEICPGFFVAPGGDFLSIRTQTILARAYRMDGRLNEAARVYEEWLRRCGGHALAHYELGQIYEEMKRPADAKREYAKFLEMWSEADEGLPQLVDARKRLAVL